MEDWLYCSCHNREGMFSGSNELALSHLAGKCDPFSPIRQLFDHVEFKSTSLGSSFRFCFCRRQFNRVAHLLTRFFEHEFCKSGMTLWGPPILDQVLRVFYRSLDSGEAVVCVGWCLPELEPSLRPQLPNLYLDLVMCFQLVQLWEGPLHDSFKHADCPNRFFFFVGFSFGSRGCEHGWTLL